MVAISSLLTMKTCKELKLMSRIKKTYLVAQIKQVALSVKICAAALGEIQFNKMFYSHYLTLHRLRGESNTLNLCYGVVEG